MPNKFKRAEQQQNFSERRQYYHDFEKCLGQCSDAYLMNESVKSFIMQQMFTECLLHTKNTRMRCHGTCSLVEILMTQF